MLQAYGDLILWLVGRIPGIMGEFAPLVISGAALTIVTYMIRRVLRRGLF